MVFLRKIRFFFFITLYIAVFSGSVWAFGSLEIRSSPVLISGIYDCEEDLVLEGTAVVWVTGLDTLDFAVGFSAGSSGSFASRYAVSETGILLEYQIYDSDSTRVVIMDENESHNGKNLITGSANLGGTDANFDVTVFEGQVLPPGSYDDTVSLYLYEGRNGRDGLVKTKSMAVSIEIPAFVAVSVVDTGGEFDSLQDSKELDFGMLQEGVSREMDVVVRANINYTVLLESVNKGMLANLDTQDSSIVPYQLEVDGSAIDLSSGQVSVASGSGPTSLSGNAYNLEFTIGDPGRATSGSYEDIVTVTVTAQ